MIYIKYKNGEVETKYLDFSLRIQKSIKEVEYISVTDSDELDCIKNKFGTFNSNTGWLMTIPWSNSKRQTWYGSLAQTILANL